jgi:hypothetical protein
VKEPFKLTAEERYSPLWKKLMAHYNERLALLHRRNSALTLDPTETAATRGRIAEVQYLLSLAMETPEPQPTIPFVL